MLENVAIGIEQIGVMWKDEVSKYIGGPLRFIDAVPQPLKILSVTFGKILAAQECHQP
tara:strand:+ start:2726 stop:2899 length:174 start_codon:yes stop_codon:yes gene_type:complete